MKITKVDVTRFEKEGSRMKGRATVQLDECFVVRDIRIIDGDNGLFIAMPSKKVPGGHKDIAHPINRETRKMFEDAILEQFEKTEITPLHNTSETEEE
ncbi:MAG: septation regulator SpoVG [Bacilli bacterium]|nr:septation regulator SpoVG [Bacilli bacterium]